MWVSHHLEKQRLNSTQYLDGGSPVNQNISRKVTINTFHPWTQELWPIFYWPTPIKIGSQRLPDIQRNLRNRRPRTAHTPPISFEHSTFMKRKLKGVGRRREREKEGWRGVMREGERDIERLKENDWLGLVYFLIMQVVRDKEKWSFSCNPCLLLNFLGIEGPFIGSLNDVYKGGKKSYPSVLICRTVCHWRDIAFPLVFGSWDNFG